MKDFFKGMLFVLLLIPVLECITSIISYIAEFYCTKIAVKTYGLKKDFDEEEDCRCTHAIGFSIPTSEYEEEDE